MLDGVYRFNEPAASTDFTYMVLVHALTEQGFEVTKAHRQTDDTAEHQSFNFAMSVNPLDFDVIWLIGFNVRNSTDSSVMGTIDALGAQLLSEPVFIPKGKRGR